MPATKKLKTDNLKSLIEEHSDAPKSYIQEEYFLDREVEQQIRLAELKSLDQNIQERKKYAHKIFMLTGVWSILIFIILFLVGWKRLSLSDKVIITLITSTTINFFGFFFLVTKYLFNAGKSEIGGSSKRK